MKKAVVTLTALTAAVIAIRHFKRSTSKPRIPQYYAHRSEP